MRIAYIVSLFPKLSETFVYREIAELRRQGAEVLCFSIHHPENEPLPAMAQTFREETTYLWPPHPMRFVFGILYFAATTFNRFGRTLNWYWRHAPRHLSAKKRFVAHFFEGVYFAYLCKQRRVDYIHAHFANGPSSVAMAASMLSGIPFGFTCHAQDIYADPLLLEHKIDRAQVALTISEFNRQYICKNFSLQNPLRLEVQRVAVDLAQFRAPHRLRPDSNAPLILSIGRLVPKKGFIHLIRVCEILAQQKIAFRCWIIGEGPERGSLQEAIKQAGLQEQVNLLGAQADVKKFLAQAEVFVQPSIVDKSGDRDGIPTTLMEAMAMHVPVIATAVTGIPELIQHESNGLLVSPEDPEALATAIMRLRDDEQLRHALIARAKKHIETYHNLTINTQQLLQKISAVAGRKGTDEIYISPTPEKRYHQTVSNEVFVNL